MNASSSGGGEVTCFMKSFKQFVESRGVNFPINNADLFISELQTFTQHPDS